MAMIQFYKPTLKRKDMDSVLQTMVDEHIGPGERAKLFMQAFSETVRATSSVAFRSYPDCIKAALTLMGAQSGVKVAISPLAPAIYKSVLEELGVEIVYVDVDRENGCPKEDQVVSSGAEILVLYESYGTIPVRYNEQTTFAEKCDYSSVKVLEDISESIGSTLKDEDFAGSWGNIVVCALEEDCVVSSGGGAIMAVKGDYVNLLRGKRPSKYLRMPDMNAALGLVQLSNLKENCEKRREVLKMYQQSLAKTRHKQFGLSMLDFESNASGFPIFLEVKPEEVVKFANKHEVPMILAFGDCMMKLIEGDHFEMFPIAASYYYRAVSVPLYPFLKKSEIDNIVKVVSHLP